MAAPLDQPVPPPPNTNNHILVRSVLLFLSWVLFLFNGGLLLFQALLLRNLDWFELLLEGLAYGSLVLLLWYLLYQSLKLLLLLLEGGCWLLRFWRIKAWMRTQRKGLRALPLVFWGQLGLAVWLLWGLF
jgi:hypothetical protein